MERRGLIGVRVRDPLALPPVSIVFMRARAGGGLWPNAEV